MNMAEKYCHGLYLCDDERNLPLKYSEDCVICLIVD